MRGMSTSTPNPLSGKAAPSPSEFARNRAVRESTLSEARRQLILEAARSAFLELGLDGASLREIAKRAGYTPGALYTYFPSLEALYGALLEESLNRLKNTVVEAEAAVKLSNADPADYAKARLAATARAFYDFYRDHPHDLDLGFYLFNGARPRGLTPELNRRLNNQLMQALEPIRRSVENAGLSTEDATLLTSGIFAHAVGTLMLANTGRIRLFRQDPDVLFDRYIANLLK